MGTLSKVKNVTYGPNESTLVTIQQQLDQILELQGQHEEESEILAKQNEKMKKKNEKLIEEKGALQDENNRLKRNKEENEFLCSLHINKQNELRYFLKHKNFVSLYFQIFNTCFIFWTSYEIQ